MSHQDTLSGAIQSLEALTGQDEEVGYPIQEKLNNALKELYEVQNFLADKPREAATAIPMDIPGHFAADGHDHSLYFEFAE